MELDFAQLVRHSDCNDNKPGEHLSSSELCDIFGDSEVEPRVGDDYQIEIPSLMTETQYLELTSPTKSEFRNDNLHSFGIGLPTPIMWVTKEVKNISLHGIPDLANDSWSENEDGSYLLGLYIFGKDFCQVKKFVESKKMVDILSHYYGNFYGSERHGRWSDCRKRRSRKCVYGPKIFSGLRQQELLYRLFPHVSEECQNTLVQRSMSFGEGKLQLEEYVSYLKAAVGLNKLVEAVGIGKGKQDLTGVGSGSVKLKRRNISRSKLPVGKSLSNLTTAEIINVLNGDFRLSKARSSDLFWEAIWPRLLARGWESVLPEDHDHQTRWENSLVFLTPGIKKFSRKDLVKGEHYFDSHTDVLTKVASDPGLIELVTEVIKSQGPKEENVWTNDLEVDLQNSPNKCYHDLRPQTSRQNINAIKFMVVDTSLAEEGAFKMRSLPVDAMENMKTRDEGSGNTSDEPGNASDTAENLSLENDQALNLQPTKTFAHRDGNTAQKGSYNNASYRLSSPDAMLGNAESLEGQKLRQAKPENRNQLPPVSKKRRRLTGCNQKDRIRRTCISLFRPRLKPAESVMASDTSNLTDETLSNLDSPNKESSSGSTCKSDPMPVIDRESINNHSGFHFRQSQGQPQPPLLIDLNLPQPQLLIDLNLPQPRLLIDLNLPVSDSENEEPSMSGLKHNQQNGSGKQPDNSSTAETTNVSALCTENLLDMNSKSDEQ